MHERGGQQLLARLVAHAHVVLLPRPINAGAVTHSVLLLSGIASQRPDQEVPLRNLIDKALNGATSCCRLSAPHHRRETPVCFWPSTRGKVSWPSPAAVEANTRMTYEVPGSLRARVSQIPTCGSLHLFARGSLLMRQFK